jgi:hypothetical protein
VSIAICLSSRRRSAIVTGEGIAFEELSGNIQGNVVRSERHSPASTKRDAELAVMRSREVAIRLSSALTRTAAELERSADLAEVHADRRERDGRLEDAANEHRVAVRSREAAERARSNAERWLRKAEQR